MKKSLIGLSLPIMFAILFAYIFYYTKSIDSFEDFKPLNLPSGDGLKHYLLIMIFAATYISNCLFFYKNSLVLKNPVLDFIVISVFLIWGIISSYAFYYYNNQVVVDKILTSSDAAYFSMVSFTTLGYGDFYPREEYRILVATEALLGHVVLALFVGFAIAIITVQLIERSRYSNNS